MRANHGCGCGYEAGPLRPNSGDADGPTPRSEIEKREDPRLILRRAELEEQGYKVGLFWIPSQKLGELEKQIQRLQKRAVRLKLKPVTYEKGTPYFTLLPKTVVEEIEGAYGGTEQRSKTSMVKAEVTPVLVAGEEPRLRGWRLIACLDYDEESARGGAWIRVVPGETLPVEFRTVDPTRCDQCKTKRDRTTVFVLQHENGKYAVIGRTCLIDFLGGHGDPMSVASAAETLFALFDLARGMEEWGGGGGGRPVIAIDVDRFFTAVVRAITEYGWVSRAVARDHGKDATASRAWNVCVPGFGVEARRAAEEFWRSVTPADEETAKKVLDWATSEFVDVADINQLSDYGYNARMALMSGVVTGRSAGIVASLVPGYQRAMGQIAERKKRAQSEHFGTEGERIVLDLTIAGVRTIDGQYGTTYLCMFVTPEGNVAKWFASSWIFDFTVMDAVDKQVRLKATIKGHGDYKGIKETMLSRAAIAPPEGEKKKRGSKKKATGDDAYLPVKVRQVDWARWPEEARTTYLASQMRHLRGIWMYQPTASGGVLFVEDPGGREIGRLPWPESDLSQEDTEYYVKLRLGALLAPNHGGVDASPEQIAEALRVIGRDEYDGDRMRINPKRGSKRGSKKRTSRATLLANRSTTERVGPGAMGRVFGTPADPDRVTGKRGRQLDAAMDRYETFHKKPPLDVRALPHKPPAQLVEVGDALSVSYKTDKWHEDGDDTEYKHVHDPEDGKRKRYDVGDGVRWYENAKTCSSEDRARFGTCRPPRAYPQAWTRLGLYLGSFCRRDDTGEVHEINAKKSARECWLLCSPDGKMLAVYSPEPQADGSVGFLAIAAGGKLDVIEDGIVG